MGATTIWERWDSMLPDGSINPGEMTSFNHYALGAIADWMHRVVGGLAPLEPGYRRILVAPQIGAGIDWARTSLRHPARTRGGRLERDRRQRHGCKSPCPHGTSAVVRWAGNADRRARTRNALPHAHPIADASWWRDMVNRQRRMAQRPPMFRDPALPIEQRVRGPALAA